MSILLYYLQKSVVFSLNKNVVVWFFLSLKEITLFAYKVEFQHILSYQWENISSESFQVSDVDKIKMTVVEANVLYFFKKSVLVCYHT